MIQGTPEWHEWRHNGIGASEVPAIFGLSPYTTAYELWQEKIKLMPEPKGTSLVMQRGHEYEKMARAAYEFETGLDFSPECFEHPEYPFLRASLDGWCEQIRAGLEIKYVGRAKFDGPIAEHHMIQVQTQMLVCATDDWRFLRTIDGVNLHVESVAPDREWQERILTGCFDFWRHVTTRTPPPYQPEDWVPVDSPELVELVFALPNSTGEVKQELREKIFSICAGRPRTLCAGVKISTAPPKIFFKKDVA